MASYTIELRRVCDLYTREEVENWFKDYELTDYLTSSQIEVIINSGFWNKEKLAKKIVDFYFMREIGLETPALFAHYAKITMKMIMEKYLPLIYSNSLEFDPLKNVDFKEEFKKTGNEQAQNSNTSNGTSDSTSNSSSSGLNIQDDTPQGRINKQDILNGDYASQVASSEASSDITDSTKTSQSATLNSNLDKEEEYTRSFSGKQANLSYQKLIAEYRQNIVAIDSNIILELNKLFMGLY